MMQTRAVYAWKHPKAAAIYFKVLTFLSVALLFFTYSQLCSRKFKYESGIRDESYVAEISSHGSRHLLWKSVEGERDRQLRNSSGNVSEDYLCSPPSIREFPQDLFSVEQLRHGAILIHIFVSIYMFLALAYVCDDYFVASLDSICENLNLSDDIAGATFMAAGSSAPELFTSFIGLFIAHGDLGTGTIVGSAVFNILIILALVSIGTGEVVQLTWWPLCRDSISYCIATVALIGVMYNGYIEWYESLILLLLYAGYLTLMKFNNKIRGLFAKWEDSSVNVSPRQPIEVDVSHQDSDFPCHYGGLDSYELVPKRFRKLTWKDVGMMIMLRRDFAPATRFRAACYMVTLRKNDEKSSLIENNDVGGAADNGSESRNNKVVEDIEIQVGPFTNTDGSTVASLFHIISKPVIFLLYCTIPDCKKGRWRKWYLATFVMSIVWIAIFSYIMVWMVTVIGFTLEIPDVIMGIVFLAAGTSIPDAIASLIVSRQGQGDMAVSNSIGSNVFDILIGLALPWFIQTSLMEPGSKVKVNSHGLKYSVILLLGSVAITVFAIFLNKWKLDRKTGYTFLLVYLIFVSISCLIEYNVFGFVNLPVCNFTW